MVLYDLDVGHKEKAGWEREERGFRNEGKKEEGRVKIDEKNDKEEKKKKGRYEKNYDSTGQTNDKGTTKLSLYRRLIFQDHST